MPKCHYWLPLTYKPKIEGVCSGTIRQTIRGERMYKVDDSVAFHGWEGTPYHSKWSFRTDFFRLKEVIDILITTHGITMPVDGKMKEVSWDSPEISALAKLDGIAPKPGVPLGRELSHVLFAYNEVPSKGLPAQILRW